MNRFKDALDELQKRSDVKDLTKLLPTVPGDAGAADKDADPEFGLPYSSEPRPIVEPWK